MAYIRKGNVYGVRWKPQTRRHKQKTFHPYTTSTRKSDLYRVLLTYGRNNVAWAHSYYYRIYRHKYSGYTLYMGPPKISHGGIRHRPTRYAQRTQFLRQRYGMLPGDATRYAEHISRMEARVRKSKAKARHAPSRLIVGPNELIEKTPPTRTEPGDFTGININELPTREEMEKVKKEDEKEKKRKKRDSLLSEEEKEERREMKRKRDIKREAKRRDTEIKFQSKRFNTETPDISAKFVRAVEGRYKGKIFKVDFDPRAGEHNRPKQLSKNQFYILNMNEMNTRGRSLKVEDVNSEYVKRLYDR